MGIRGEIVEGGVEIVECGSLAGEGEDMMMDGNWALHMLLIVKVGDR